ncbi:MAG: hypothetical protein AB7O43_10870 [Hyphomicrobiaceae bacterium]
MLKQTRLLSWAASSRALRATKTAVALATTCTAVGGLPAPLFVPQSNLAHAQQKSSGKPALRVSPVILAEPQSETPIAIQVEPEGAVPPKSYVRIRGLPPTAKLSEGHLVAPGSWAIPLSALASLKVLSPISASGRSEISISLINVDGNVLADTRASLVIAPAWLLGPDGKKRPASAEERAEARIAPPTPRRAARPQQTVPANRANVMTQMHGPTGPARPASPTAEAGTAVAALPPDATAGLRSATDATASAALSAPTGAPSAREPNSSAIASSPKPPVLTPEDRAKAMLMLKRGEEFLHQGNIAAARQFFLRATDIGLAQGAMRLAATYDPAELSKLPVAGLTPEYEEARRWYERAYQLGAKEAAEKLSRIGGR